MDRSDLRRFYIQRQFSSHNSSRIRSFLAVKSWRKCSIFILIILAYWLLWIIVANYDVSSFFSRVGATAENLDQKPFPTEFVINTNSCQIPDFSPWTVEARALLEKKCSGEFKGPPKCSRNRMHFWSYTNGSHLHVNMTALKESGYSWKSIRCCYREIIRVEQDFERSDMKADRVITYSDECYPVREPNQEVPFEFIRLHCISNSIPTIGSVVSRQFLAFAKADDKALSKMHGWRNVASPIPPNVIILGVDSISRISSIRNFPQTRELLRALDAVELKVYSKIGETTFSNTVAFLAGYTLDELTKICYRDLEEPQDNCPYLWKAFSKLGYLTTTMEDSSQQTSFSFLKKGFVRKPVDFYFRTFVLGVMRHLPRTHPAFIRCLDGEQVETVLLRYLSNILDLAQSHNTPLFGHVWINGLSHQCATTPKYSDNILATSIQSMITKHPNTILIFMSDHGEAFGDFRETVQGWYEDHLPMFWMYLPDNVRKAYPEWQKSLSLNSGRLTSHFDLYKTLVNILQVFDKASIDQVTHEGLQRGQTLLQPVPENRSCATAGIPEGYCVCFPPKDLDESDPMFEKVGAFAVEYIAKLLPLDVCELPVLKAVNKVKFFYTPTGDYVYVVTFSVNPGEFLLEATVKEDLGNDKLVLINKIVRLDKMKKEIHCTKDPGLKKYCYCK